MRKTFINHPSLLLVALSFSLFSATARGIVGIPDDKRFINCRELYSKESSSDYSDYELVKPAGKTFVHACYDNTYEEWVVIKAATGRTFSLLSNESLFFGLTSEIPAVIKQYETIIINDWRYEVMEYGSSGDLYQYLEEKGKLSEDEVRFWFRQIAEVLYNLHELKIVHLDIKLENFFLKKRLLKIGDFGFAEYLKENPPSFKRKGSSCYMAPEILLKTSSGKYDPYAADVFSAGSVMFTLFAGGFPFQKAHFSDRLYRYMLKNKVKGLLEYFNIAKDMSPEAIDLLEKMLSPNPKARPTMKEVLEHPWLSPESTIHLPMPKTPVVKCDSGQEI